MNRFMLDVLLERTQSRLEQAFWAIDDIVVAFAPDAPENIMDMWQKLHDLMTPEFIERRDELRHLTRKEPE